MSHFSCEIFDFRVLSEEKGCNSATRKSPLGGYIGVAYELLSRNSKVALLYNTKSVKLGFENWLENPLIFPISGHSARTLRRHLPI